MIEVLRGLPEKTRCSLIVGSGDITIGELRDALAAPAGPILITTREAARRFSYAPETWAGWAADGKIEGAFRDRLWRLPVDGCESLLEERANPHRRIRRGPWKKAALAQARDTLPQGLRRR